MVSIEKHVTASHVPLLLFVSETCELFQSNLAYQRPNLYSGSSTGDAGCVSTIKADIAVFSSVSTISELRDNLAKNAVFILPVSSGFMIYS